MTVQLRHLIGVYYLRHDEPGIGSLFLGDIPNDQPPTSRSDEVEEIGWFDPTALPAPPLKASRRWSKAPLTAGSAASRDRRKARVDGMEGVGMEPEAIEAYSGPAREP